MEVSVLLAVLMVSLQTPPTMSVQLAAPLVLPASTLPLLAPAATHHTYIIVFSASIVVLLDFMPTMELAVNANLPATLAVALPTALVAVTTIY